MVDGDARVLRADATPVRGLYAGGGAACGISGRRGSLGYVSGNGLLSALGLGLIAGRAAAGHAESFKERLGPSRDTRRTESIQTITSN
jgi:fumarate reductase flavoprotein subunit